jgi:hypothetical protein
VLEFESRHECGGPDYPMLRTAPLARA